ncbi:MAG TPA: hypothetical protein VLF87_01325 [Patescibacteria group bacterium]|nr:hypothetical protein [Patescibacteria group bacterium]
MRFRKQKKPDQPPRRSPNAGGPAVFSYYARGASNDNQNTGRNEGKVVRAYKPRLGHLPSYIALLAIVIASLYACYLQPNPHIAIVTQNGTVHRSNQVYQEGIANIWHKSLLNQTKLTLNSTRLQNDILQQFPELAGAKIELPLLGRRPSVVITPGTPALKLVSVNGEFYVDNNGKVMAQARDVQENKLDTLAVVHDETGARADPGKVIIPGVEAEFLQKLQRQLMVANLKVVSITLPANAANEADVHLDGIGYFVKFSTTTDPRQSVGSFMAAKAKLDADNTSPGQYIDVRVDEKVFYQ